MGLSLLADPCSMRLSCRRPRNHVYIQYNAIASSGLLLQLDCPDLAMTRVTQFSHLSLEEFKKVVELQTPRWEISVVLLTPRTLSKEGRGI